jgi:hypothetical protein
MISKENETSEDNLLNKLSLNVNYLLALKLSNKSLLNASYESIRVCFLYYATLVLL